MVAFEARHVRIDAPMTLRGPAPATRHEPRYRRWPNDAIETDLPTQLLYVSPESQLSQTEPNQTAKHRGNGMRQIPLFLASALIVAAPGVSAQVPRRPFLFKDSRGEVAAARVRGESDVLVVVAAMPGANPRLARAIAQLGGTVRFRDDDVDYIRARIPVDSVELLASHAAVHSLDISITGRSRTFGLADLGAGEAAELTDAGDLPAAMADTPGPDTTDAAWPPVLSDYPLANRYSPLADIRAEDFLKANPTFDGRGVTIAMIDLSPDPLLPELQAATTLDGQPTPKIAIYETAMDAEEEDDGRWLRMSDMVVATDGLFLYRDSSYTAPRNGTFRIAMFDEAKTDSLSRAGLDKDVNRDENPAGSSRLFAVLWDEETNDVWVDTDQDLDFTNETALTEYNERQEFGVFGTDDPDTPVRESVAFGIQIDRDKKLVALNLGVASHASLVVGAAVASRGTEGRFDGVAPGARLASVSEGGSAYGQTEATIKAVKHPSVDVVYFEQSSLITRNYLLRDGRLVPTVIYERLVEKYRTSIVSPTHNYPILGGIDDFVLARGVIGIGGHESKENFFTNHGVRVEHDDNLLITGGYGPMGNGALQPDVISPSNYVSTARGFEEGRVIPGLFQLPPGYTIAGGTSTATPTAAGAVALLISAAKQEGVPYDAYRIKHAITRSARYVQHLPAYKQGNGVVNVAGAWQILRALGAVGEHVTISGRAPVRHSYSHLLPTPNEGVGLFERDGWNVGDREERTITLTRTAGPSTPMTFTLSWAGNNDATFSAPLTVTLPLHTPVEVPITIAPSTHGAHTAHLTLDHPDVPGYAYRMLATVVVAEPLTAANKFSIEKKTEVPRPGMRSFFYRVPTGLTALKIDLSWSEREVSLTVVRPDTREQRGMRVTPQGTRRVTQIVPDPMPGVWEVRLTDVADTRTFDWEQAKKPEPVPPTPATLTISGLATQVTLLDEGGELVAEGSGSRSATTEVWLTNRMAEFTGGAVSNPMGSARRERREIADKEQQMFEVEVLPGSPVLLVTASNPSDPTADIDVYVFDCTGEECRGARADADPVGDESVIVENPAAGKWRIVVDAASVPTGNTTYEYLDVVFNPAYGMVSTTDLPQERSEGARWTAKVHSWIAPAAHAAGRVPYAALLVQGRPEQGEPYTVSLHGLAATLESGTGPDRK